MSSINKTPPNTLHDTTPELARGGLGNLEKLPAELRQEVVDQLADAPHSLAAFAATSKLALKHTNQGLKSLVPPAYQATPNRLGEWTTQFRTLAPEMRQVLKATSGILSLPDIFSPIEDQDIEKLHNPLATAMRHVDAGNSYDAKESFALLEANAKAAGVPVPDATGLLLAAATRHVDAGNSYDAKESFAILEANAKAAGVPVPDATPEALSS